MTEGNSASLWDNFEPVGDVCGDTFCRVCHGESEESRPLYHPCRCDGSIKFVHNDCLLEWLRISKKTDPKCELCGEMFTFRRVYAKNAPLQLSVWEFISGVAPRVLEFINSMIRGIIVIITWGLVLPLFTSWWADHCCSFLLTGSVTLHFELFHNLSLELISLWWNGVSLFAGIVMATYGAPALWAYMEEVCIYGLPSLCLC